MRKTILTILGSALLAASTVQIAAAAEHYKGHKIYREPAPVTEMEHDEALIIRRHVRGDQGAGVEPAVRDDQLVRAVGGGAMLRPVGAAIYIQAAGAADAFSAVMPKSDRLLALMNKLFI